MADPFTAEQLEALNTHLGTTVNNMMTARLGTLEKKLTDKIGGELTTSLGKLLEEKLKDFKPAEPAPGDGGDGGGGKGGKNSRNEDIRFATMEKELKQLRETSAAAEARAKTERAKNRAATHRAGTFRALAENGIDGEVHKEGAYALLRQNDLVRFRDEESDDLIGVDAMGVETELGAFMKEWVKSPQAKLFIPAAGTKGSGARPLSAPVTPGSGKKREVTYEDVGNMVLGAMNGGRSTE